jgi:phosphoribulokinase
MNTHLLRRKRTRGTARMKHFRSDANGISTVFQSFRNTRTRGAAKLKRYLRIARAQA